MAYLKFKVYSTFLKVHLWHFFFGQQFLALVILVWGAQNPPEVLREALASAGRPSGWYGFQA